jgi:hypothetical protein
MYENARREVLEKREPPSWASERVRQYGLVGLFPDFQRDFPFILYRQSVPRPAWFGKRDFHQERLDQVYEFLLTMDREIQEDRQFGHDASRCGDTSEASPGGDNCPPVAMRDFHFSLQGVD